MTKEEIIELQAVVARGRRLFWQLLIQGQFTSEEHAKAVFACFFALSKVNDLVTQFFTQLPLEEPKPSVDLSPLFTLPGIEDPKTTPLVNSGHVVTQEHMAAVALDILPKSKPPITGVRLARRRKGVRP